MSVNLLAISIGNTRTQVGVFIEDELREQRWVPNDAPDDIAGALRDLSGPLAGADRAAAYLASVNEPVAERVAALARDALDLPLARMERDAPIPIGRKLDPEAIVGEDRLLNAAGAYDKLQQACIVVDAGTAVTVDFIDGEGTFHGGAILPGAAMMLDALHRGAAQLPQVEFARPEEPIGHSTQQAMRSGAFHGLRGAVRELAEKYAEFYRAYPKIIATGGDAAALFEGYELVEAIVPELTLLGIAATHRHVLSPPEE